MTLDLLNAQLTQLDTSTVLQFLQKAEQALQVDYQLLETALTQVNQTHIREKTHQMKGTASLVGCQALLDCLKFIEKSTEGNSPLSDARRQMLKKQLADTYLDCQQILQKTRRRFV